MSAESRRYINLPNRPAGLPFSDAVLVGDTLYITGRIGLDPATGAGQRTLMPNSISYSKASRQCSAKPA